MCDYCGCREVPLIGELMSEHRHLQDEADQIRRARARGDRNRARMGLRLLVSHLERHVAREENGIFAALRKQGDYSEEVDDLEGEHRGLDAAIVDLDADSPQLATALDAWFDALDAHIEREDLGIFPVSVVTLGAEEWDLVQRVHDDRPSFLDERAPSSSG